MTDNLAAAQHTADHISWSHYLFGDPWLPGVVTWIGTLATFVGFFIAVKQLRKATAASVAAKNAAETTAKSIGSHEFSAKLTNSLEHMNSAQEQLRRKNPDAAAAYLQVAWSALVDAQSLSATEEDTELLIDLTQRSRRAIDGIRSPTTSATPADILSAQMYLQVGTIIEQAGIMAARVRMRVSGLGSKQS